MSRKGKKILVVKVGSHERPATPEDIADVQKALKKMKKSMKDMDALVTNHAVTIETMEI